MNLGDLITRLQTHFSPEERGLLDGADYPGRTEAAIAAINAAMQFLFSNHAPWARRGTHGFILHAPATAAATVTYGSTVIGFGGAWLDWFEGCACRVSGSSAENRIRGIDPDTNEVTLELPHDGATGSATVTLYHDSLTLPHEIGEVLSPVCIKGASMLAPVPSVTHLPGYSVESWEDYGMQDRVTRLPVLPQVGTTTSTPRRYCVDSHQHTPYSMPAFRLRIFPAPAGTCLLEARVRYAVPIFSLDDNPGSDLPIPHGYAESILVPVAEKHLTRSPFFRNDSARKGIEDAYTQAVTMLRTLNPQSAPGTRLRSAY